MAQDSVLWRRLDSPGHDVCRLERRDTGWQIRGTAVFQENGVPMRLDYQVVCDAEWVTQQGVVEGWIGTQTVQWNIRRTVQGVWSKDGQVVPGLEQCMDLDLGFTPATNLLQLRRIALNEGQAASVPVAWLDVSSSALQLLNQRYERRTDSAYWYESPQFDYEALLEVTPMGFIRQYPGLWEMEARIP